MRRFILWLAVAGLALTTPALVPLLSPNAAAQDDQLPGIVAAEAPQQPVYRSPGDLHKIRVNDTALLSKLQGRKSRTLGDYGSFAVVEVDTATFDELKADKNIELRDDYNLVLLNAKQIDTTTSEGLDLQKAGAGRASGGRGLHLVQFPGPIQPEWYQALENIGVEIVTYIPNNSYLVYGSRAQIRRVQNAAKSGGLLQWEAPYSAELKLDPAVSIQIAKHEGRKVELTAQTKGLDSARDANLFAIQMVADETENQKTLDLIDSVKSEPITNKYEILKYVNVVVAVPTDQIKTIAARPDVVSVQPYVIPQLRDERQNQIMAGNLVGNAPQAADYLAYLAGKGFTQAQFDTSNFAVDVSDDGLDNGLTTVNHPNLHVGGVAGTSRVVYNVLELSGGPTTPGRTGFQGHGNLNSHVIAGFVAAGFGSGFPHADAAGFRFGLGIAPFVRVGQSAIFNPGFTNPNFANLQSRAYNSGARISSNSWGANTGGAYTIDSQAYDALVRDAQPTGSSFATAGNQEMVIVFSAGNAGSGANTVGSPGNGKNVFCVGAAENVHSHSIANGGDAASGADGCGVTDTGADSANDIIGFSSRGPCDDGRIKPDIQGPGTHITGGVAQDPSPTGNGDSIDTFTAASVCALSLSPGNVALHPSNYFPLGQQWYTTSSGTSHSCPAVAGTAALVRQDFINRGFTPPSPAMTKAIIMNSARYMTGVGANDNLYSNNQGMGEVNLNTYFDIFSTTNILRDQLAPDMFTATGQQRAFTGTVVDNTKPFRVTLAWTDAPGPTSGNAFINNLDLEVTVGGQTFKGNVFTGANSVTGGSADIRNNVESVLIPAGVTGPFVVRVKATNIAGDGVPGVGGSIDQDFALVVTNSVAVNLAVVASAGATITAEGCTPANGAVDPGETVTVDLCVQNVGTADTVNLVGTLQATGGVTSPSGPQTYGVVVAGGAAVCRPFTFTASGNCGGTITATLALQDGATNLGTVTFTFQLGAPSPPVVSTFSSGNIAVPIPDVSFVEVPISVSNTGIVGDVNVSVRLNHTFDGDLIISLIHPDGSTVTLSQNRGGAGLNYGTGTNNCTGTPTVFDDSGGTPISAGAAPFAGTFIPEAPLSALNGKPTNGIWKLRVEDNAALDVGTIGCVTIHLGISQLLCCPSTIVPVPPAVLTAESCTPANSAVDPDETVTMDFSLQNLGPGNTTSLVATLQATGGVTAPSGPQNYGVLVAAGPAVARPFTFTASTTCGGVITATFTLQDGAFNLGTAIFTIPTGVVSTATTTFSNPGAITIPNPPSTGASTGAPSNPYPSTITVSGVTGTVTKVTATLTGFSHTFPDDVDVMMVGPTGAKILLMSDVGGSTDAVNANLTLDDAAAATIPDAGPTVTGTFKPSNVGAGDQFPAPAPAPPVDPQLLSTFNGLDPNGTWSLFVVDDLGGDIGSFAGGWSISITTSTTTCCVPGSCTITCPANVTQSNDPDQCGAVVNYPAPTTTGTCGMVDCSPPSGSFFPVGTTTVNCTTTAGPSCSFTVTVNDTQPPAITCPANVTVPTDSGQCTAVVNYVLSASDNCPGVSVVGNPASGSTFPLGTTTVTGTATDAAGNTATCSFTVTVVDTQPPTLGTCPTAITAAAPGAGASCVTVTFATPTASDNCPGVTVACSPASGTCFPLGTTTVTCTATDAAGNTASCSFTVTTFNVRLQDDSKPANVILWNSTTGAFCAFANGQSISGTGNATKTGSIFKLSVNSGGVRIDALADGGSNKGQGTIQKPVGVMLANIKDTNLANDTSTCQ